MPVRMVAWFAEGELEGVGGSRTAGMLESLVQAHNQVVDMIFERVRTGDLVKTEEAPSSRTPRKGHESESESTPHKSQAHKNKHSKDLAEEDEESDATAGEAMAQTISISAATAGSEVLNRVVPKLREARDWIETIILRMPANKRTASVLELLVSQWLLRADCAKLSLDRWPKVLQTPSAMVHIASDFQVMPQC